MINNIQYLTIQYNNLCLKDITSYKKFKLNNQERQFNSRKYNRDFQNFNEKPVISSLPESTKFGGDLNERIKKMEQLRKQNNFQPSPNVNNNMNNIYNSNNFNQNSMSNHFNNLNNNLNKKPQNLMEKMAELEKSRGLMKDERPPTPDFLKSEQVGNKNQIPQRAEYTESK